MCLCVCVLLGHNICIYYSPAARFSIRGRQTTDLYALVLLYMHGGFHPDFIMMGQSDRWDRLSWIHNLRLPLLSISLPSPCSQSQKLMHWLHLHKNNIILSNRRPTDASSRLDRFLTTIRSPRVIHSHPPYSLCHVFICMCKCSARWAASSLQLKDSFGSDSERAAVQRPPTQTVNSPQSRMKGPVSLTYLSLYMWFLPLWQILHKESIDVFSW